MYLNLPINMKGIIKITPLRSNNLRNVYIMYIIVLKNVYIY